MHLDDDRYQEALDDWRHGEWLRRRGFDPTSLELEASPEDEDDDAEEI